MPVSGLRCPREDEPWAGSDTARQLGALANLYTRTEARIDPGPGTVRRNKLGGGSSTGWLSQGSSHHYRDTHRISTTESEAPDL